MSEKNDRLVDSLLDESLRQYGRVQPRAGLEARLLRRLEEQRQTDAARWKFFRLTPAAWGSAAAAAAVLIAAVVLTQQPRLHRSSQANQQANQQTSQQAVKQADQQAVPQAGKEKAEQKTQRQVAMATSQATAPPAFSGLRGRARQDESPKGMNAARPLGFHLPGAATGMASVNPEHALVARVAGPSAASIAANMAPKRAQFPTALPATREEQILAQVVQHADPRALQVLAASATLEGPLQPTMVPIVSMDSPDNNDPQH